MSKKEMWHSSGGEDQRYPDFIKESQAAYQTSANPALGRLLLKKQGEYTREDYYALPEQCRVELIDGVIYNMSAPSYIHQVIAFQMAVQLDTWIKKKKGSCMVFVSPADVQLDQDDGTMVQPDLFVVCDRRKIQKKVLYGAPDFVVEILSPANAEKEQMIKYHKYRNAGVREYWVVDPREKRIKVHNFDREDKQEVRTFEDKVPVHIFNGGLEIDFAEIYQIIKYLYGDEE